MFLVVRARKATVAINEKGTDNGAKQYSSVLLGIEFSDLYSLFQLIFITSLCSRNSEETEARAATAFSLATQEPGFKRRTESKVYPLCIRWPKSKEVVSIKLAKNYFISSKSKRDFV